MEGGLPLKRLTLKWCRRSWRKRPRACSSLKHALPLLDAEGGGTVVMVSSLMGSIADCMRGKSYAYRASKTALNMFATAMKNELLERNIGLLIVHPGWVETDMGAEGSASA